jgi:glucose uptake protein GlcU
VQRRIFRIQSQDRTHVVWSWVLAFEYISNYLKIIFLVIGHAISSVNKENDLKRNAVGFVKSKAAIELLSAFRYIYYTK